MPKKPRTSYKWRRFWAFHKRQKFLIWQSIQDCLENQRVANMAFNVAKRDDMQNKWRQRIELKINHSPELLIQHDVQNKEAQQLVDQTKSELTLATELLGEALKDKRDYTTHLAQQMQQQQQQQQQGIDLVFYGVAEVAEVAKVAGVDIVFYGVAGVADSENPIHDIEDKSDVTLPNGVPDVTLQNVVPDVTQPMSRLEMFILCGVGHLYNPAN